MLVLQKYQMDKSGRIQARIQKQNKQKSNIEKEGLLLLLFSKIYSQSPSHLRNK